MKLNELQRETLSAVASDAWRSAYPGLKMNVLYALEVRGLVASRGGVGAIAMPTIVIKWGITKFGRECLLETPLK